MFDGLNTGKTSTTVGRTRIAIAVLLVVGAALVGVLVASHAGGSGSRVGVTPPVQSAPAQPSPGQSPTCESRLLQDWGDGRIDGVYRLACYRAALRSLPLDLEIYSSARDDIAQALSERIVLSRHAQKISAHQGAASQRKIPSAP
jgi:hypothetical protein